MHGGGPLIEKAKGARGCASKTGEREKLVKELEKLKFPNASFSLNFVSNKYLSLSLQGGSNYSTGMGTPAEMEEKEDRAAKGDRTMDKYSKERNCIFVSNLTHSNPRRGPT